MQQFKWYSNKTFEYKHIFVGNTILRHTRKYKNEILSLNDSKNNLFLSHMTEQRASFRKFIL